MLGIVNEVEWAKETSHSNKKRQDKVVEDNTVRVPNDGPGRPQDRSNTPDIVRKLAAELAIENVPHKEILENIDIGSASLSAYKNGATSVSTYNKRDVSLGNHIDKVKNRISRKARRVVIESLDKIPDKLGDLKATELSIVAKNASSIIKDMEPKQDSNGNGTYINAPQFLVYAPQFRNEGDYGEVIDAGE